FSEIVPLPGGGPEIAVATATASSNVIDASLAVDHDAATRWESVGQPHEQVWFAVDLGHEQDVAEVDVWARLAPDLPRGVRFEVSTNGETWRVVREAKDYWRFCSWAEDRPLPSLDGWIVARFEPIRCRWIRITDVGEHYLYYWAIAELKV